MILIFFRYQDAAVEVPYHVIKSSMANWRRGVWPASPKNLDEFHRVLTAPGNEKLTTYNDASMTLEHIVDNDGEKHEVFYDPVFVRKVMPSATKIFIDATFQTTPRMAGISQLLTVMVVSHNHVSLKLACLEQYVDHHKSNLRNLRCLFRY